MLIFDSRIFQFNLSRKSDFFCGFPLSNKAYDNLGEICVVLQGPLSKISKKLSVEYIRRMKSELKVSEIIYCGPDYEMLSDYVDLAIPPENIDNVSRNQFNLQRASALTGLMHAKSRGHAYALKLRADAMLTRRDAIAQLHMRLVKANKRIVAVAPQKPFYKPFLGDHLQYGTVEDLIRLWQDSWEGGFDINMGEDSNGFLNEDVVKSPEWVLGRNLIKVFGSGSMTLLSPASIGYILLKYDYFDINRFDWESVPHFGRQLPEPGSESFIDDRELDLIEFYGSDLFSSKIETQ